jgi:hypothetical protein
MLYKSTAIIFTYPTWIVAHVDSEISRYYYSLIPKYIDRQPQMYPPHITIVRHGKEKANTSNFGRFANKKIRYYYDPTIYEGNIYFWLNAYSTDIEQIRVELGLTNRRFNSTIPQWPFNQTFHITLGNKKLCQIYTM